MTTHRERTLGQARADLVALPDLVAELARLVADRHHDVSGYRRKVIGSPAPLQLPVVHLVDVRHKPGWWGADPRERDFGDRYGITPTLEAWVRVLWEELPEILELTETATVRSECAVLVEFWPFVEAQQWAVELAEDVQRVTGMVKAQLGIRPEYRPRCRKCGSTVIPVDADRTLTSWEACAYGNCTGCDWTYPKGPALDALAQVQPAMPLAAIADTVGVAAITLRRYEDEGLIRPVGKRGNTRLYDLAAVRTAMATMRERTPTRGAGGKFIRKVAQDA